MTTSIKLTATLSTILTTAIEQKKKDKSIVVTTCLDSSFKAIPKAQSIKGDARLAYNALESAYELLTEWACVTTPLARHAKAEKVRSRLKTFLAKVFEVPDSDPIVIDALDVLWANIACKRSQRTDKKTKVTSVRETLPSKVTVIKQWLFAVYYRQTTGQWIAMSNDKKAANARKNENEELWAQMAANKAAFEEQKRRSELMAKIIASNPELQAQFDEAIAG